MKIVPIKLILLSLAGIIIGIILAEVGARILKGVPERLNCTDDMFWAYVDIHNAFFRKDTGKGLYLNQRMRSQAGEFAINKPVNGKRVFIIGESVAACYDARVLKDKLQEALPAHDWEVINCGMGGYDSHRILLVARDIARYEPDIVVLMMGNNEGCHNPVELNYLKYKYPILSRFWVTIALTNILMPETRVSNSNYGSAWFRLYEINLKKIADVFEKRKVPLVVCTLPVNFRMASHFKGSYSDQNEFLLWWTLQRHPQRVIELIPDADKRKYGFCIARAYEKCGEHKKAIEEYVQTYNDPKRIVMIKQLASDRPGGVVLADINKLVTDLSGGITGSEYFIDSVHYRPEVYALISDKIINSLRQWEKTGQGKIAGNPQEWSKVESLTDTAKIIHVKTKEDHKDINSVFGVDMLNEVAQQPDYWKEAFRNRLLEDCVLILGLRDQKANLIEYLTENKEYKWSVCLALAGEALREEGYDSEALVYFNDAIKTNKNNYLGYLFRGLWYWEQHNSKKADADFNFLKKLDNKFNWISAEYLDSIE